MGSQVMAEIYRCRACGSSSPFTGMDSPKCPVCQVVLAEFSITCSACKQVSTGPEISSPGYCPGCGDRYHFTVAAELPRAPVVSNAGLPPKVVSEERPAPAPQPKPAPPEVAKPTAEAESGSSLLIRLKQQAADKLANEAKQTGLQVQQKAVISKALSNAYSYLSDFTKQVNVLKPDYPGSYILSDQVKFDTLAWKEGFADFRVVPGATDDRLVERVTLNYALTGKNPIVVEKEPPGIDLFARSLHDNGLLADVTEFKNHLGRIVRSRFSIKREIPASLLLVGDYVAGDIRLRIVNIQRLGAEEYRIPADALTQTALEEVALLVLGASKQFVQRFKRAL